LRLLVTPKWVALSGILLLSVALFGWLGWWQWARVQQQVEPARVTESGPPADVSSIYVPGEPVPVADVGRSVRLVGRFDASAQLLVPRLTGGGDQAFWVLTPLQLVDGSVMPVVRGWTDEADSDASPPPTGQVVVTGRLEVPESDSLRSQAPELLPEGQIAIVSSAELFSLWEGDLYQGFVVLDQQRPPTELVPVEPLPVAITTGLSWQNLAYAIQWWLFAVFAVFFWWRMLQADGTDRQGDRSSPPSPDLTEARS